MTKKIMIIIESFPSASSQVASIVEHCLRDVCPEEEQILILLYVDLILGLPRILPSP